MTSEIKKMMNKRNNLYRKAKNNPTKWEKFKTIRNKISTKIKEAKDSHNKKLEDRINNTHSTCEKTWWKLVKQIMNSSKSSTTSCPPLVDDDTVITNDKEKANKMNDYFADQSTIDTSETEELHEEIPEDATLSNIRITGLEVQRVLLGLKVNSACGPDGISPRVLKRTSKEISAPLS